MSAAKLPRTDVVTALIIELRLAGYAFREEFGGKHGKLIVDVDGREEAIIVSLTPSDRRSMINAVSHLRRRMRQWKAGEVASLATETSPARSSTHQEKRTLDDTTALSAASNHFLRLFFEGQEIRVRDRDGGPWFVLADVCRALDLSNPTVVAQALDGDEKAKLNLGRGSDVTIISESGLYAIVLRTRNAMTPGTIEHRFRRWVTSEVLPNMRRGAGLPAEWARLADATRMLTHKVAEQEKTIAEILAFVTAPAPGPGNDLAGTVTASAVIDMAGVRKEERVRGTSAIVTRHLKDFCLPRGLKAYATPEHIDPSKRWRFPAEAAREWLFGESRGAEIVRAHVARQRAKSAMAKGRTTLEVVGARP